MLTLSHICPPMCAPMVKSSLKYMPFFNLAAYVANTVFVDRSHRGEAMKALKQSIKVIKKKNFNVIVFPEGTRNPGETFLPFKKGAFNLAVEAQIPIVPAVISSYRRFYDYDARKFDHDGYVIVEILEPVSTENLGYDDVTALTERVRSQMLEVYGRISVEVDEKLDKRKCS